MITITTMTLNDNILIISSITNDIDIISVALLVVKRVTEVETILVIFLLLTAFLCFRFN